MAREKRRAPRFHINQLIELEYGKESFVRASGLNISEGGLLCKTEPYLAPSSRVFLSVHLSDDEIVNCEGIVVRSERRDDGSYAAISFVEFEGDAAARLVNFLKAQALASGETKPTE